MRAGFVTVWRKLTDRRDLPQNEAAEIAWLRTYSNYLTPKLGAMSADTWAALATVLRNMLLNWLVMLPVLCAALIGLKMLALVMVWFGRYTARTDELGILPDNPVNLVAWIGLLLLVFAVAFSTRNRPTRGDSRATLRDVIVRDVLPSIVGLMLLVTALLPSYLHDVIENHHPVFAWSAAALWVAVVAGSALVFAIGWLASLRYPRSGKEIIGDFIACLVAGAIGGGIAAVGIHYAHLVFQAPFIHGVPYRSPVADLRRALGAAGAACRRHDLRRPDQLRDGFGFGPRVARPHRRPPHHGGARLARRDGAGVHRLKSWPRISGIGSRR